MKRLLIFGILLTSTMVLAADELPGRHPSEPSGGIAAANQKLGRGINLGNALEAPREGDWGVTLKPEYFQAIKQAGFDTVRLPIRWSAHAQAAAPYTLDPQFARRVDWAIDQALANQLNVVVNVHHYEELDARPEQHLPRLLGIWRQIGERYANRPPAVYFELLNEPSGKLTAAKWNAAVAKLLAIVRKTNPRRPIIVGPVEWNSARALDNLELPRDDRNLILTVHFYDPFTFTHQGAPWVNGADQWKGQRWTGTDAEQAAIRGALDQASQWARQHHRPVFLGEFGTYEEGGMESRARWTRFVAREAELRGFSWAYWEFCSGFGAFDPKTRMWRPALKSALLK